MSQEQIAVIERFFCVDDYKDIGKNAEISLNLNGKCLIWDAQGKGSFGLKDTVIKAKFEGEEDSRLFYASDVETFPAQRLLIGYSEEGGDSLRAFLSHTADGSFDTTYHELEEFVVVSTFNGKFNKPFEQPELIDRDRGIFVCFSKTRNLLHIDTPKLNYCISDEFDYGRKVEFVHHEEITLENGEKVMTVSYNKEIYGEDE